MRFVMLPCEQQASDASEHLFLYAKILGIYHAKFVYKGGSPCRMDFVHVRWLYYDYSQPGGLDTCRLDRLSYEKCRSDQDVLDLFDFVDPNNIIQASHLIPDFDSGISSNLLNGPSVATDNEESDWNYYYVNLFVDRDMLMRYLGGGVGHCSHFKELTETLEERDEICAPDGGEADDEHEEVDNQELPSDQRIEGECELDVTDEPNNSEGLEKNDYESEEELEDTLESDLDEEQESNADEGWDDLFGF
ncbi:hypothetical protein RhiJN_09769 [Ceratobasidium sp. AG-Ba]|nr:hypothetical protein RhiJN_09769 [Ceratobasidium sp. AG-Ba]